MNQSLHGQAIEDEVTGVQENNQEYLNLYEESGWEKSGLKRFCDRLGISRFFEVYWKRLALAFPVIVLLIYGCFYFQKGISFDGRFYRTQKTEEGIYFEGFTQYDRFEIAVEKVKAGECQVIFRVNNEEKQYHLTVKEAGSEGKPVTIYEDEMLYFEGFLEKSVFDDSYYLKDKNGEPDVSWFITIQTSVGTPDSLSPRQLVNLYLGGEVSRGSCGHPEGIVMAVILFGIWLIDIHFPRFFFTLNYRASVRDPEPTDWYVFMQKLGWVLLPIAAVIVLGISLL